MAPAGFLWPGPRARRRRRLAGIAVAGDCRAAARRSLLVAPPRSCCGKGALAGAVDCLPVGRRRW
eukprot:scaffold2779_cov376-Prasinococcus_capsulatus_cf.AAC.11